MQEQYIKQLNNISRKRMTSFQPTRRQHFIDEATKQVSNAFQVAFKALYDDEKSKALDALTVLRDIAVAAISELKIGDDDNNPKTLF